MNNQSNESRFVLKSLQEDFQYLSSMYANKFDKIDRIVLFQTNTYSKDEYLEFPLYVWHNFDRHQGIEKQQWLIEHIKEKIIKTTSNHSIHLSQVKDKLDQFTKDNDFFHMTPVHLNTQFEGFVCYEKKASMNEGWTEEEIGFLNAFATVVVITLMHMGNQEYSSNHQWVMNEIMNQMNNIIYITDFETDEILYMNQKMKEDFNIKEYHQQKCWRVLHPDLSERCKDCVKKKLMESNEKKPFLIHENFYPETGKTYESYNCLMKWNDGRFVHLHLSTDISERKQLYKEANIDELTSSFTRRKGKNELERVLNLVSKTNQFFNIVMLDVNDLKQINDKYGHLEGDRLLVSISKQIHKDLQKNDFMCRLSGDEFFIVFMNCKKEEAVYRMNNILEALYQDRLFPNEKREEEFCYGCVEVHAEDNYSVKELLSLADERLYDSKRTFHIRKAEERLNIEFSLERNSKYFNYDTELLYGALIQSIDDYIFVCNMNTGVFCYPQTMVDEFDLPGRVIENAAAVWSTKIHENDKKKFLEANQVITDGRATHHTVEYRAKNHAGEWVWLRCRGNAMKNTKGETVLFAGIITNMGRQNKVDITTGLFNRQAFEKKVERILEENSKEVFTMMILNIDDFKRINSLNSRSFGDGVIKNAAQKIQSLLSPSQSIYRLEGDEFGIIIRNDDKEEMVHLFNKIQENFKTIQSHENKNYFISFSAGSATSQVDATNFIDLNKFADYALDKAKKSGKNKYLAFTKDILDVEKRSQEISEIMRESMEKNFKGFSVHYQPIVHNDGSIAGAEALARFHCEKYGDVYPMEFISLLEDSNLIVKFGEWIFEEALKTVNRFRESLPSFKMGVNLSIRQTENSDFPSFVKKMIQKYQVPPKNIVLELTESCIAHNIQQLSEMVNEIRAMNILVVMDDFGTGYSSLGLLKEIKIDILKIDRIFVNGLKDNGFDHSFIKLVVKMCKTLSIDTLLEGIEEQDEYEIAKKLDLTYFQGFHFGKPVLAKKFEVSHLKK